MMRKLPLSNKTRNVLAAFVVISFGGALGSCSSDAVPAYVAPAQLPALGAATKLGDGVVLHKVELVRGTEKSNLWVYLPEKPAAKPLPCVIVAPAGTRMFHGMKLGAGDMPEHTPYAKAGFAVVAYELDGHLPEGFKDKEMGEALLKFQGARAGVENAKSAINYALARVPNIDKERIYAAGHSSAATAALVVAEHEPRIKACLAYAPICDLDAYFVPEIMDIMKEISPSFPTFIHEYSPLTGADKLRCPAFIFHASDDTNSKQADVAAFVVKAKKTNNRVTYIEVPTGGHYESMIDQGIPQGIAWLKTL